MHQASIIEYVGEKASQQTARESILEVLALRLQPNTAEIFKPTLDAIEDMERLKQLLRAAALADRIEDFTQALESNQD